MTVVGPATDDRAKLQDVRDSLTGIAGSMDARFVRAGRALASAHDLIEALIASLDGVTGALDHEAAQQAVAEMQASADHLLTLPAMQAERAANVDEIKTAGEALMRYVGQIERTLSFLHICGLNLKVASAGAEEFTGFVEHMFSRLDFAQAEVRGLEGDVKAISTGISGMVSLDKALAAECAKVIPHVPRKLVTDAEALRTHQTSSAALADKVSALARSIRGKMASAIGALQIGDITRQRLEHVADGLALLEGHETRDPAEFALVSGHVVALLAAQASDAAQAFRSEARILTSNLDGLGPDAVRLLAFCDGRNAGGESVDTQFLRELERGIADVDAVTAHLHRASAQSRKLGTETTEMADRLSRRLRSVRKVQRDVAQMAWNTGLRCRNMGQDGQGLAVMSTEIRNFANSLAEVWSNVSDTFDRLLAAAAQIDRTEGSEDAHDTLSRSLERIRSGGESVESGLAGLSKRAPEVAGLIKETSEDLDCDLAFGAPMADAATALTEAARPAIGQVPDDVAEPLRALLDRIAALYTMAREREVHKRFAV